MKPSPSLQKTTDSIGCSVRGGIEELVVTRPDREQCERNDGKDQHSADEPRSRSASKPSTDASSGGQQSEYDLHYRRPAVTRAEDGGRYHSPAFHPRGMLCEVDVEGSARKERCCKNGYKLERGHQGLLTPIMTSRTALQTSGGCGNQIGVMRHPEIGRGVKLTGNARTAMLPAVRSRWIAEGTMGDDTFT